ncbi:MAG TPA: hypothetical protein V6D17_00325, partial [Candidatus Obscuribacterales bacterium]
WRVACFLSSVATVSKVLVFLVLADIVARRVRLLARIAVVLALIACVCDVQANVSMMVAFSDLSMQIRSGGAYAKQDLVQLCWIVINQALGQTLLIANLLYAVAGTLYSTALFLSRTFPRWLFWLGLAEWTLAASVTLTAFLGLLTTSFFLAVASVVGIIIWLISLAIVLDLGAKPEALPAAKQVAEHS